MAKRRNPWLPALIVLLCIFAISLHAHVDKSLQRISWTSLGITPDTVEVAWNATTNGP
ncbi:hypothetical protein BD410DRAFT_784838 [Rickenella mellea]|uniref:Uncharacterized protein n=1 Tax=Rickenella mellea TaxID=50990 RepID=A0A4Y7QDP7_9AGAM|nr:hypothetical protein BD410DRAFT_784838 [Rickenella mellea]